MAGRREAGAGGVGDDNMMEMDGLEERDTLEGRRRHSQADTTSAGVAGSGGDQTNHDVTREGTRGNYNSAFVRYAGEASTSMRLNSGTGSAISKRLTVELLLLYQKIDGKVKYSPRFNPKRVLTKPSEGVSNYGKDNANDDLILYVDDRMQGPSGKTYIVKEVVGSGTFGQVARCIVEGEETQVAVKVVKNKTAFFHQARVEVGILDLLNTRYDVNDEYHLVRMGDYFVHERHLCIVMELLHINLYDLLRQNQFRGLSMNLLRVFVKQILSSLQLLRKAHIIHCDLKPENILLKSLESGSVKLIDFGSACLENRTVYSYIQSRFYRSPEVVVGHPYTSAIDIWSLGCVAAELFLGLPLFPVSSEHDLLMRITETIGPIPPTLLSRGRSSSKYFGAEPVTDNMGNIQYNYRLLTAEEVELSTQAPSKPSKRYFAQTRLEDIILEYRPRGMDTNTPISVHEQTERWCFLDFLRGVLQLDPNRRWTPYQASQHPFLTQETFTGPFVPPLDPTASSMGQGTLLVPHPSDFSSILSPEAAAAAAAQAAYASSPQHAHVATLGGMASGLRVRQQRGLVEEVAFTAPGGFANPHLYGYFTPNQHMLAGSFTGNSPAHQSGFVINPAAAAAAASSGDAGSHGMSPRMAQAAMAMGQSYGSPHGNLMGNHPLSGGFFGAYGASPLGGTGFDVEAGSGHSPLYMRPRMTSLPNHVSQMQHQRQHFDYMDQQQQPQQSYRVSGAPANVQKGFFFQSESEAAKEPTDSQKQ